jgi:putative ABC transport system ATP-binding protein
MAMLRSLNADGTIVIMLTHSEHDAKYASRVIRLFDA